MLGKGSVGCGPGWGSWVVAVLVIGLALGACSPSPKRVATPPSPVPPSSSSPTAPSTSDKDLFLEAFAWLGTSTYPADYGRARELFDRLVRFYPESKWRPYADAYRKLLEELRATSDKALSDSVEKRKAQEELDEVKGVLEQFRKSNRLLQEKIQTDTVRLQQENEQLRHDLQRLKQLEIEMQRRGR